MGDRCYMEITCKREHLERFESLGFHLEYDDKHWSLSERPWVRIIDEEANYGHSCDLQALAKEGIPFFGYHGEGGDYGACDIASDGTEYSDVAATHDLELYVRVLEDGAPNPQDVETVKAHIVIRNRARELVGTNKPKTTK